MTLQQRFTNVSEPASRDSEWIIGSRLGDEDFRARMIKINQRKIGLLISAIAGGAWLIDAATKQWAHHALADAPLHGLCGIPNLLYFILGTNYGGSNGIPNGFVEFCLTMPALVMFCAALWLGKRLRTGGSLNWVQIVGFGLFFGGALSNWSERALYQGVTDFIYLAPFDFCIFNLADIFIDSGFVLLFGAFLLEGFRRKPAREKFVGEKI